MRRRTTIHGPALTVRESHVLSLIRDNPGSDITQLLDLVSYMDIHEASVYRMANRFGTWGYVVAAWTHPAPSEPQRPRRTFTVTDRGRAVLAEYDS